MNTAERLGFPRNARLLIVNIDDYGLCHTANQSAIHLLRKGAACSCTVMAPAPWGLDAVEQIKENPDIQCGVHLTAISEHLRYRWRPLSSPEKVPSLVDEDGYFFLEARQDQFTRQANVRDLETEWRAQIEFVLRRGVQISHLDSHCNVHDSRDDFFEMTFGLACEYRLPLRIHTPEYLEIVRQAGKLPIDYPDLDSFRVPLDDKPRRYIQMLRELPQGLSEWAVHPAYDSEELRAITPEWSVRTSDYQFFNSDEFLDTIRTEGIELASYSLLKPYWN